MPARTRASNHDASSKVYFSKKVPKQRHFPERRKIVRRKPGTADEEREYRQTAFAQQRHGAAGAVQDSEDDEEEEVAEQVRQRRRRQKHHQRQSETASRHQSKELSLAGPKRKRNGVKVESADEDEEPIRPTPKRRRAATTIKQERTASLDERLASDAEEEEKPDVALSASKLDSAKAESIRRRRQSTMTQIVDGRRPRHGYQEPEFKPIKRAPRKIWNGRSIERDTHQRTLTQMVPSLVPLGIMSDEDEEEDEEYLESESDSDSQAYNDAIVAHFSRQGIFSPDSNSSKKSQTPFNAENGVSDGDRPILAQSPQERSAKPKFRNPLVDGSVQPALDVRIKSAIGISKRTRFGLLSTPEKRRVSEIASSQSPAESMLSTQSSPSEMNRSPLKERSKNRLQNTPSRKKQVAFQKPNRGSVPPRPKKKFENIIKDSDEEDASWSEADEQLNGHSDVDENTFPFLQGANIGKETQAMLDQIDRACAHAEEIVVPANRDVSQELGEPLHHESPATPDENAYDTSKMREIDHPLVSAGLTWTNPTPRHKHQGVSLVKVEDSPSSPIVIKDEPSDDEHNPTPPQLSSRSLHPTPHEPSQTLPEWTDLDGEPIETTDSPSQRRLETQQSHCSKAEQQLHSEFTSYTQYRHQPQSFSMHVAHDAFSYQATQFPAQALRAGNPPQGTMGVSQATTVDGTQMTPKKTPRKAATQPPVSANTTPRKARDASVFVSPQQPPPLIIPSSFPTPSRTRGEIWSSPTFERHISGNGASIEDFSIPPLPPLDDDIEDDL